MPQHHFPDNQLVSSPSNCPSQRSELVASESMYLLKRRQTRFRPSAKFFHEAVSCSQQKGVTENLVGKEAMVNLECLEELAKMLLGILKPLSVINSFHHGRNSCLVDSK
jgi:hypothetical protein